MKLFKLSHYFLPHPETHAKPHLLHWHYLLIYLLLFILLKYSLELFGYQHPGVLGVNSNIAVDEVISGTNLERQKNSLPPLSYNAQLSEAARLKALNMFEENYWAHFSPSGRDPWGFILGSGYKFSYAGENLARNFYTSDEVVKAWMDSPSHKDNILNSRYQEIGVAVVDGVLNGQKTTLVVQMFGTPYNAIARNSEVNLSGQKIKVSSDELTRDRPVLSFNSPPSVKAATLDPQALIKNLGLGLMGVLGLLFVVDYIVLKRRGIYRYTSHHLAHMGLLALSSSILIGGSGGSIL